MRQDRDRVVRAEADLVGDLVGPADDQPVDVGEALRRRERRPAVDDDRLEAELAGEADERARDLDATDDDEPRPDREDLDEQRSTAELDGPRQAAPEGCRRRASTSCGVQRPASPSVPVSRAVVGDDQLGLRRRPVAGLVRPELAGGESAGSGVMTAEP